MRARWLVPDDEPAASVISSVRERVAGVLPPVDAREWIDTAQSVEGWLTVAEATLLAQCVAAAPSDRGSSVVEIGSYKGRSTLVIALAIVDLGLPLRVLAVDPHTGYHVGGKAGTHAALMRTLREHAVESVVDVICARSIDVRIEHAIVFAFIDGLHDAGSVRADHNHVATHVIPSGLVAFHDYRERFPGVMSTVNDLLGGHGYDLVGWADSLVVLRRL
jgi:predicted O-methyltransferase YrrM